MIQYCRLSKTKSVKVFSLGKLYASDFVKPNSNFGIKSDLTLYFNSDSKLLQLETALKPTSLYGKYWYRSGINTSMRHALKDVVDSTLLRINYIKGDVWLDVACNDGTLLSYVPKDFTKVGIDPADDSYKNEAIRFSDDIIQDFFSADTYQKSHYGHCNAKVITAVAMFYDLEDPIAFLNDVYKILDKNGTLVLQLSYTPLMIQQLAFDNICHEHICYYSLTSLQYALRNTELKIVDCELNDVNGGSFRVYIKRLDAIFKTQPFRDVANLRIASLLDYEQRNGFNDIDKYAKFYQDIMHLRNETVNFIKREINKGKIIWAYGASTKGNTLLQWYNLDITMISGIAERSPYKYGLKTVGTNIPIFSEEEMRKVKPDYLLILPWHFVEEFKIREKEYLDNGGAFIIPCPRFEVIDGNAR